MKYTYREGVQSKSSRPRRWLVLPLIGLSAGLYVIVNVMWPAMPPSLVGGEAVAQKLTQQQPLLDENRLYIPQIGVDVAIVPIKGNEAAALEKGAIHRAPESGNPLDGGNFVIAAHRFQLGWTPWATRAKSPFYHIDKLTTGDQFFVDYEGKRYAYEVKDKQTVPPNAMQIEAPSEEDKLTLYSCELSGPEAGREVIIARPIGTVAWINGEPKLKSL